MDGLQEKDVSTTSSGEFSDLFSVLTSNIPKEVKVKLNESEEASNTDKISEYNNEIIKTYVKSEAQHLEQQKTVAIIISIAVGIQLILFNILIYLVVLGNIDFDTRDLIFNFMKYYIGAVIVEMVGLCVVIVKGVYSLSIDKMAARVLERKK